tara:strand:- start:24 stop:743 length:720 start_codon:yes stop_codon:yes gene_type:complete
MKNDYFDFCSLCFRSNKTGESSYYCVLHQPKSNSYNVDRNKLIKLKEIEFKRLSGHKEKINFLSQLIDQQAVSPLILKDNARRLIVNKKLSFSSCIDLINENYSHSAKKLEGVNYISQNTKSWVCEYLKNLGLATSDYQGIITQSSDNEVFDILIYISARYHAIEQVKVDTPDGRKIKSINTLTDNERHFYLNLIRKTLRRPNGRINRTEFAKAAGLHRKKGERVIKKLKDEGYLGGNI